MYYIQSLNANQKQLQYYEGGHFYCDNLSDHNFLKCCIFFAMLRYYIEVKSTTPTLFWK